MKIFDARRLRVRKLTPKEYGILQAFPMGNWKQVVSDSQAYKQFGNAVTTTVFTPIAEEIKKTILQSESEEINMEKQEKAEVNGSEYAMNTPITEDGTQKTETKEETMVAVETDAEAVGETADEEGRDGGNIPTGEMAAFITETLFNETLIPGILYEKIKESILQTLKQEFDGKTIGEAKEIKRDWEAAENAIKDIISKYAPSGYMGKAIYPVLMPLKERLENGERTADLFNAIVEATR